MYSNAHSLALEEQMHRGAKLLPSWGSQKFYTFHDVPQSLCYTEANSFTMPHNRGWEKVASANGKQDQEEYSQDSSKRKDGCYDVINPSNLRPRQFTQRCRVRKLQYISELERNVQVLQDEGMEVSAELEFLDQQNLILNLENKILKQRLDNLAQVQIIKRLQQKMLECEIARLQALYQQQPSPRPPTVEVAVETLICNLPISL